MSPISKTEQRARLRVLRKALAIAAPDAAERAAALLPLERLPAFATFAGYHALGSELDPSPLIRRLAAVGAMLTLPVALSRDAPPGFRATPWFRTPSACRRRRPRRPVCIRIW